VELQLAVTEEETRIATFIQEQHEDLLNNFDPKVVRLQKRRKIMIHNHAFDDLAPDRDG
jgi:Fe-S-cluster formation regulator IscX/YfhJ